MPKTLHAKPYTPNPKTLNPIMPKTLHPKPQTLNPKYQNLKPQTLSDLRQVCQRRPSVPEVQERLQTFAFQGIGV